MKQPSRRQKWAPYFRAIADKLALKDWTVTVDDDAPDGDAIASVYCCVGRKIATVRLSEGFLDKARSDQRHTVVHELVHAQFAPYVHAVERRTNSDEVLGLLMEYSVDGLADAVAPLMPLPPRK